MCGASRYRPLTQGCCACKYVYPKGIKKCCYGRVIPKRSWCIGVLTCGWHRYNPLTHGCCSGRRYYKRSQKCCHGLVIPRASTCVRPLKCGKYNYYPFTNGCCGGKKPSIEPEVLSWPNHRQKILLRAITEMWAIQLQPINLWMLFW